jgi:N utilization substance protein A
VPEDQLSLAIGRDGQNARLAAKLTSWRIDIKSLPEAATDALYKLQNDPEYDHIAEEEQEICPQVEMILAKKAEGRPVTPEEYQVITKFVERVERGILQKFQAEKEAEEEKIQAVRATLPPQAFEIPLEKFEIADRVYAVISEGGFRTVGDLMLQMEIDSDKILALHGMGPKGMKVLQEALENLTYPEEPQEEIEEEATVEETEDAAEVDSSELVSEVTGEDLPPIDKAQVEEPVIEVEEEAVEDAVEKVSEVEIGDEAIDEDEEGELEAEGEEIPEIGEDVSSLEELFTLRPDILEYGQEDGEFEDLDADKKKKKEKKKKFIEIEYDPDADATIVKRKRKRGEEDWEDQW